MNFDVPFSGSLTIDTDDVAAYEKIGFVGLSAVIETSSCQLSLRRAKIQCGLLNKLVSNLPSLEYFSGRRNRLLLKLCRLFLRVRLHLPQCRY